MRTCAVHTFELIHWNRECLHSLMAPSLCVLPLVLFPRQIVSAHYYDPVPGSDVYINLAALRAAFGLCRAMAFHSLREILSGNTAATRRSTGAVSTSTGVSRVVRAPWRGGDGNVFELRLFVDKYGYLLVAACRLPKRYGQET